MLALLTATQTRVLYWLARGKSVKEIALIMGISRRTIAAHISSARIRLSAKSRDEAVALAVQAGLLDTELDPICT